MTDLATYLAGLKAGDVVVINDRRDGYSERRVSHTTPKQLVVGNLRYWKKNGDSLDKNGWGMPVANIVRTTPKIALIIALRETCDTLKQPINLSTIPAMRAALDRAEAALREGDQ